MELEVYPKVYAVDEWWVMEVRIHAEGEMRTRTQTTLPRTGEATRGGKLVFWSDETGPDSDLVDAAASVFAEWVKWAEKGWPPEADAAMQAAIEGELEARGVTVKEWHHG